MVRTSSSNLKKLFIILFFVWSGANISSCLLYNHTIPNLPVATMGVLDLRNVDFQAIETLPVMGELEFYWHSWEADRNPVYIWGVRGWRIQFPQNFPFDFGYGGYGTYRFVILLPSLLDEIGIYLPPQHSAYVLWIDGQRVAANGEIGSSPTTYRGEWKPQVVRIPIRKPVLDFVLQISDYSMNTGGYFYPLRIGLPHIVEKRYIVRFTAEVIAFGVLLFVGLYCFLIYIVARRALPLLFLGISSILFAFRTVTHGEMVFTLFFAGDVDWVNKIRYFTLFILPIVIWGFFRQFHSFLSTTSSTFREGRWLKGVDIGFGILSGVGVFITLVTPSRVFVPSLSVFPFYVGILAIFILYLLVREIQAHNAQGWILLIGFAFLVITVVRDLHISSNRLWDNSFYSPFGYVFFILSLAMVIGQRFYYLFEQQRMIALEQSEQAQYLESLVQERTHELQEANTSLAQAVKSANAANEAKSQFLAMMSHEIRTPMNVVVGITELLERTPLDANQLEYVQTLRTAAGGLLVILNDVLDLSRLEAGTVRLELIETDLAMLMQEVVGFFRTLVEKKRLYLKYSIDSKCPSMILTDPTRLKQVLANLIGNAVKFTSCGGVQISASSADIPTQPGYVKLEFQVVDTGIGIPPDKIPTIFESFMQADSSISRRFGGTGLGLTISKQLVHLMGGDMRVSSIEGKGSTFSFSIVVQKILPPVQDTLMQGLQAAEKEVLPGRAIRVLLVEDNAMNRMVGEAMIQSLGWECLVASHGLEATQLLQKESFDLVLMDVEMPEMDGIETTRRIRLGEAGQSNASIPIVALSAHVLPEIQQKTKEAGMNGYLMKPICREKLYKVIQETSHKVDVLGETKVEKDDLNIDIPLYEEVQQLITQYNGNGDFVISLYRSFAEEITHTLPLLEEGLKEKDFRSLSEGARTLQNVAILLERNDLSEPLSLLQRSCHREDLDSCLQLFQQVAPILLAYRERINLLLNEYQREPLVKSERGTMPPLSFE
mgnify:FL=1